jgi:hypothetical protein
MKLSSVKKYIDVEQLDKLIIQSIFYNQNIKNYIDSIM